jgi:hypothetical protein
MVESELAPKFAPFLSFVSRPTYRSFKLRTLSFELKE